MGARAARITREELLTPPEFRDLQPAEHPAARVGGARIELVRVGDETRLGSCYQQVPVRLMPPFVFDGEPAALLYLINLTAGLMDGDGHRVEITAQGGHASRGDRPVGHPHPPGCGELRHPAMGRRGRGRRLPGRPARPDDPVPRQPLLSARPRRARPTARLIWGDIWLPGRYDRGELSERFQFERIVQDFEARRAGRLVYRDRFRWDGPWTPEEADWYFGGALASASLFVAGPVPEDLPETDPTLRRSVFRLDTGATCMRWCGHPAAVTADLVLHRPRLAASWTVGPEAPPWLLASSGLAPNHWFSTPAESVGLRERNALGSSLRERGPSPDGQPGAQSTRMVKRGVDDSTARGRFADSSPRRVGKSSIIAELSTSDCSEGIRPADRSESRRFSFDPAMRPVSNACSGEPREVPDAEVNPHRGNPGSM